MTASESLKKALTTIKWDTNVSEFCAKTAAVDALAAANMRLAIWSKQLEQCDKHNPALSFVREMQVAGHLVATSTALAIYKSAAASCRTVVESALYYTYYRTHPAELATLLRNSKWYMSKNDIVEYHNAHTAGFGSAQKYFPFVSALSPWYSDISAVVHGQVPGAWLKQTGISGIGPDEELRAAAIEYFTDGVELVNRLFFCTIAPEFWDYFSTTAKKALLHGVPGAAKVELGLDAG